MKKETKESIADYVAIIAIILFISATVICTFKLVESNDKTQELTYQSWIKLTNRDDITFKEWKSLRKSHMLESVIIYDKKVNK